MRSDLLTALEEILMLATTEHTEKTVYHAIGKIWSIAERAIKDDAAEEARWFPELKKRNHAVCPKCRQKKPISQMKYPYDTDWVPRIDQQKWCEDCIDSAAEDQEQRKFERFHGG